MEQSTGSSNSGAGASIDTTTSATTSTGTGTGGCAGTSPYCNGVVCLECPEQPGTSIFGACACTTMIALWLILVSVLSALGHVHAARQRRACSAPRGSAWSRGHARGAAAAAGASIKIVHGDSYANSASLSMLATSISYLPPMDPRSGIATCSCPRAT